MKGDRRLTGECALIHLTAVSDDYQDTLSLKLDAPIIHAIKTAQKITWSIMDDVRKAYKIKPEPATLLTAAKR